MKPITVQLDRELLEIVLKLSREEHAELVAERDVLDERIGAKDRHIRYLEDALSKQAEPDEGNSPNGQAPTNETAIPLSPSGRLRRGAAQGLVRMFLKTRNGVGATINEICQATQAKYGTAHRLVKLFESKDMAVQSSDGRWHWKANVEHQDTLV
jgi:hypothetical protein